MTPLDGSLQPPETTSVSVGLRFALIQNMAPPRVGTSPVVVAPPPLPMAPPMSADTPPPPKVVPPKVDGFDAKPVDPTEQKLDQVEKELTPTYTVKVDGTDVSADVPAAFRMNGGNNQPTPEAAQTKMTDTLQKTKQWPKDAAKQKELKQAILQNAYGRATPDQIKLVTDKLIAGGSLKPYLDKVKQENGGKIGPAELKTAIRRMQWDYGVGADCNGVCRVSYRQVNGKQASAKWGDDLIPVDGKGRSENPNFKKVDVGGAKPGDVIKLDDVTGDVGHYVTVTNAKTISAADAKKLSASPAPGGPLKQVTVLSSWGADGNPDDTTSGVNKQTWVYDDAQKKWGTLEGNTIAWSNTDGPYEHKMVGVYRPVK